MDHDFSLTNHLLANPLPLAHPYCLLSTVAGKLTVQAGGRCEMLLPSRSGVMLNIPIMLADQGEFLHQLGHVG